MITLKVETQLKGYTEYIFESKKLPNLYFTLYRLTAPPPPPPPSMKSGELKPPQYLCHCIYI